MSSPIAAVELLLIININPTMQNTYMVNNV